MSDTVIEVDKLTKRFGDFTAVNHVTFNVQAGEVLGYVGPNGSGKTTTIRMLLGLLQPSDGNANVLGYNIRTEAESIRPLVGYMSQKFALYDELTMRENLDFYAGVYDVPRRDRSNRVHEILELLSLTKRQNDRASDLSGGWRQRLALGTALVHQPKLLFLDEPTSGVDPSARRTFWDLIYELASRGTSIFVTTHYMDEAEHCNRVGIMFRGQLLAMDTPSGLKASALPGAAWDVSLDRGSAALIAALTELHDVPGIVRAGLASDRLRMITAPNAHTLESLKIVMNQAGFAEAAIEQVEPTLEDVFIALAGHGADERSSTNGMRRSG
ncbi:MAG TPA: ABC transporter ATP-binding protein [Anaerolineae bacterium]|nr:ABC transporter ATP-binding protein [Anaerolineae bacterium]